VAAEEALLRALHVQEAAFGPDHPQLIDVCQQLGLLAAQRRDQGGARRWAERVLTLSKPQRVADPGDYVNTLNQVAFMLLSAGAPEDALEYLRQGAELASTVSVDSGNAALNQFYRGITLVALERPIEALDVCSHAALALTKVHMDGMAAQAEMCRGEALILLDRFAEALQLLDPVIARFAKEGPSSDPLASARLLMARALWGSGKDRPRAEAIADEVAKVSDSQRHDVEIWRQKRK
jgi:tetratricopeptide (TPR) repeat protein